MIMNARRLLTLVVIIPVRLFYLLEVYSIYLKQGKMRRDGNVCSHMRVKSRKRRSPLESASESQKLGHFNS